MLINLKIKCIDTFKFFDRWGEGGGAWLWRRPLRAWEEEQLGECRHFLFDIVLQPSVVDQWLWRHDPGGGYSVRGAYTLLTIRTASDAAALTDLLWHKQVLLKVSVLAWRLLRNRLPTWDNLVRRHIITPDSQLCVTGCGGVETTHHMFLSCPIFASLWHLIRGWVGVSVADLFSRVNPCSTLLPAAPLALLHLGGVARTK
jgi:hypothetical protein